MSLTFAIPDLHGCFDLALLALDKIRAYQKNGPLKIVWLGDYIDRGQQSAQLLDFLMLGAMPGDIWIRLKGNHESMMSDTFLGVVPDTAWWVGNGGGTTVKSYEARSANELHDRMARHVAWINRLPLYHVDKHRVYVHAGVDPVLPMKDQDAVTLLWKFSRGHDPDGHIDTDGTRRHVVHGHIQKKTHPLTYGNRTCLDAGAFFTGTLAVGVFNDDAPG